MSGTKIFVLTQKLYLSLIKRGMNLTCQCVIGGNGPCHILLVVNDTIVSKPSKHGRKYYLKSHFDRMIIDLNGNKYGKKTSA